jgi:metal-sulfur cluster biosynthetic enzyme
MLSAFVTEDLVNAALKAVIDPELGVNIVDLGLIYRVDIGGDGRIAITMTLTTPGCPMHAGFAEDIEQTLWQAIPGLSGVDINLVWEPRWSPAMISAEGMEQLGLI